MKYVLILLLLLSTGIVKAAPSAEFMLKNCAAMDEYAKVVHMQRIKYPFFTLKIALEIIDGEDPHPGLKEAAKHTARYVFSMPITETVRNVSNAVMANCTRAAVDSLK